jgi:hypothetical protein
MYKQLILFFIKSKINVIRDRIVKYFNIKIKVTQNTKCKYF